MSQEKIYSPSGALLYTITDMGYRKEVHLADGTLLGYCQDGKTYTPDGTVVAQGESPGILYKG